MDDPTPSGDLRPGLSLGLLSAQIGVLVAVLGDKTGFAAVFLLMAASYLVAIVFVRGIRSGGRPEATGPEATRWKAQIAALR